MENTILSKSPGEKRLPDEPTIIELFGAMLERLTHDQCAVLLDELGHEIKDPDVDTKKYLAMLFVDVLNDGYKEYLLLEKNANAKWFE